jgi:frataxin-like iron-binding protein CyaY
VKTLNFCFVCAVSKVEKYLVKIEENVDDNDIDCTILFEITDLGGWFVKFRNFGVIINNRFLFF